MNIVENTALQFTIPAKLADTLYHSIDKCEYVNATAIVKGLRAVSDFESELQMAQMNRSLSGVETLFIPTSSSHSFIASRLLREVAKFGGDVAPFVPEPVRLRLAEKFQ